MVSQHTHALSARAEQSGRRRIRIGSDRIGSDRIGSDGFGGVGMAAVVRSPPVPRWIGRRRWLRRAGLVGPVGPVGSRKLAAAPGRTRAGQEDGVGEQRSGVQCGGVRDDRVCVVQGSVHSGRRAQESSRSDRRWRGRRHRHRVDVVTIARPQWARRRARSFNEAVANRGALSPQVQPVKEVKGKEWKRRKDLCMDLLTADRGAGNVPRSNSL